MKTETKIHYAMISMGLAVALMLCGVTLVLAQNATNSTTTNIQQAVEQSSLATITAYASLGLVILSIIGGVLKMLHIEGKAGQAITIGTDAFHAIYDDRAKYARIAGIGAAIAPEETQRFIQERVLPIMAEGTRRAQELEPKLQELDDLANRKGKEVQAINFGRKFDSTK